MYRKWAATSHVAVCAVLLSCAGCGTYLHDDQFASQAAAAKDGFAKIDLTQRFSDQSTRLSSFEATEDKAVAEYAVENRNRILQQVIGLPAWADDHSVSGPESLSNVISNSLANIIGTSSISASDEKLLRQSLGAVEWDSFKLQNDQSALQQAVHDFQILKSADDKRSTACTANARLTPEPPANITNAEDLYKQIQHLCGQIAAATDPLAPLKSHARFIGGDLSDLIHTRDTLIAAQKDEEQKGEDLQKSIDDAIKKAGAVKPSADTLVQELKPLQDDLRSASGFAKFLGYQSLANHVDQILAVELPLGSTPAADNGATSETTKRAQAVIGLALGLTQLQDVYSDQPAIQRVNSLLLANAGARHAMATAKLEVDFSSDMLKLVNAEIDARLRQVLHLSEAQTALGGHPPKVPLSARGFATLRGQTGASEQIGALGAWIASQDEGEIPYQVLRMKEVQLLRAKSVKEGQISAQGYSDLLTPILAELDAYGQHGLTTQTLVQLLGFAGVISSISAK